MKIKLDENLPFGLVGILSEFGHEIDTIPQEGLKGCNDEQVWEATQREGWRFCKFVLLAHALRNVGRFEEKDQ
jgi:predicted nuclease of predicted toxin-antitoxin system